MTAMVEREVPFYVGPAEIRGAQVAGVFRDQATLRVVLKARGGLGLTLTFRGVTAVVDEHAEGMTLGGLTRTALAGRQRYAFANADPQDGASLEVTAESFEVGSAP
jgi:hypothetical protein